MDLPVIQLSAKFERKKCHAMLLKLIQPIIHSMGEKNPTLPKG